MRANPGGIVAPNDCIGRDHFIKNLWHVLHQQSVVLVAERRSGKTTILQKMLSQHSDNDLVIFRDVEGISRPTEFVHRVYQDVESYLSKIKKTTKRANALLEHFGGAKAFGFQLPDAVAPHWKDLLESILTDLAQNNNKNVVLLWDELPWMLQKIIKNQGNDVVIDLLDTLRGLRQTYPNLRMVYTGSIGLHHVTTALTNEGYSHSPINDMRTIKVLPLDLDDAIELALALLKGEQIICADAQQIARQIAELTDNVPYYIHLVIAELTTISTVVTVTQVQAIIADALNASYDPWKIKHYRDRLPAYYLQHAPIAQCMLDQFAEFGPLTISELQQKLQLILPPRSDTAKAIIGGDIAPLRSLISALKQDHYLIQNPATAACQFQFQLICRWW